MGQLQENPGVTALLVEWRSGNQQALERLTPLVYEELKRLAERMFRRESAGHTLQPTALVNEAFEALVNMDVSWQDRTHFFALSARLAGFSDSARGVPIRSTSLPLFSLALPTWG